MHRYSIISVYTSLPEDEPSGSKHVEDLINKNISLEKWHFVGLYCIIILQCTVRKKFNI